MKKKLLNACLVLAMCASPVLAKDLLVVLYGVDEVTLIDRDSIKRSGNMAGAWIVWSYETQRPATDALPAYRSIRIRLAFDCSQQKIAVAERRFYGRPFGRGNAVARENVDNPFTWKQPASATERTLLAMACEG
ncbi:MAG: surface-adhesin E family protein [Burkholderiales bacterium]